MASIDKWVSGAHGSDHYAEFLVSSFPGGGGGSSWSSSPLPVELIDFSGYAIRLGNQLEWQTSSELNNEGFAIERSSDGADFEEVGYVAGSGTSQRLQYYRYLDEGAPEGLLYYRLRQIDVDGGQSYSGIISIYTERETSITIYPNPATDRIMISAPAGMAKLYNASGTLVKRFKISRPRHELRLDDLQEGLYLLHLALPNGGVHVTKVIRTRKPRGLNLFHKMAK